MPLRKVQDGDRLRIPAAAYNAFVDAARFTQAQAGRAPVPLSGGGADIVMVKNTSGADRNQFEILGLGDPVFTPTAALQQFKNAIVLEGTTPTTATHLFKFVVCLEPIPSGKIGQALLSGLTPVQLDVVTADDEFCDVKNSDVTKLQTAGGGSARIIWKDSGTGTKWGIVRLGDSPLMKLGKTDASHAKAASGTVSVWTGTPGSESDSTKNITAYNRFAAVGSGKWVASLWNGYGWYLISAEC